MTLKTRYRDALVECGMLPVELADAPTVDGSQEERDVIQETKYKLGRIQDRLERLTGVKVTPPSDGSPASVGRIRLLCKIHEDLLTASGVYLELMSAGGECTDHSIDEAIRRALLPPQIRNLRGINVKLIFNYNLGG